MQSSLRINQDLTFQEFFSGTLYFCFSSKLVKRAAILILAGNVLSIFVELAANPNSLSSDSLFTQVIPIIAMLLLLVLLVFVFSIFTYTNKSDIFKNVTYDFTHWGIIRNAVQSQFSKPWRDLTEVKESKEFFILYFSNTDYHLIQKRMIGDKKEVGRLRTLLIENTDLESGP